MLGRKVIYVRCISCPYNNVAKGISLLDKKATLVYTGKFFMQVRAFERYIPLNELGKEIKCEGLPSILSLFRNEFNKFNNTRARMLDSIYHMTNTLKSHFWRKNVIILSLCTRRCYGRHNVSRKSINH